MRLVRLEKICGKRLRFRRAFLSGDVPRAWSVNTPEISADINPGKRHPYFPPVACSVQSLNLWRHRLRCTAPGIWTRQILPPTTLCSRIPHVELELGVVTFSHAKLVAFEANLLALFDRRLRVFNCTRICFIFQWKTNNGRDRRHGGRVKRGGDRRAVNTAVTGSSDIWAAKWLGAAVTSYRAAPQKDKKDSEIRFTSGLPEMGRKLQRAALCRAIYLSYRYPISALWHVISSGDPFNFYARTLFNQRMAINSNLG